MRLIDADALLQNMRFSRGINDELIIHVPLYEVTLNIEKAPTVGGWISVKDRLPEPGIDALWCAKYEPERVNAIRYSDHKWDIRIDRFTGCVNHGVPEVESYGFACIPLYWMPLPEPPGGDE